MDAVNEAAEEAAKDEHMLQIAQVASECTEEFKKGNRTPYDFFRVVYRSAMSMKKNAQQAVASALSWSQPLNTQ